MMTPLERVELDTEIRQTSAQLETLFAKLQALISRSVSGDAELTAIAHAGRRDVYCFVANAILPGPERQAAIEAIRSENPPTYAEAMAIVARYKPQQIRINREVHLPTPDSK